MTEGEGRSQAQQESKNLESLLSSDGEPASPHGQAGEAQGQGQLQSSLRAEHPTVLPGRTGARQGRHSRYHLTIHTIEGR